MHSLTNLLLLFFIYSFAGWVLETIFGTIRHKVFTNKGLVTGPFCVIYGIGAVVVSVTLNELTGFWLFVFAMTYATIIEWVAGHLIEKFFGERWWDYSGIKGNLDGYICLPASALWGALGYIIVRWGNHLLITIGNLIPGLLKTILVLVLLGLMALDIIASAILLWGRSKQAANWEKTNQQFDDVSRSLRTWIAAKTEKRIHKAYPKAQKVEAAEKNKDVFAYGCSFYKIIWLFFIGAFLGDITETIFCRITAGVWMSRSSVVWGPFSIVWGLGVALVTLLLYKYRNSDRFFLFAIGTLLGGVYEYFCSVFTEIVFGKVFWDYSQIPFNIGGRINLLYCFFWGIAAVVWFRGIYPFVSKWIEKIPKKTGKIVTWIFIAFMCCNIVMSCMALVRYDERSRDVTQYNSLQTWLDTHYDDARMERIYPNAKQVD